MKKVLLILLALALVMPVVARKTKTTQSTLRNSSAVIEAMPVDPAEKVPEGVEPNAVTIKGYSKRASDNKESFLVTNNTNHRMSQIVLKMRYTTVSGALLHERTATVSVSLKAGETQLVSIRSWDVQRLFYYFSGPKPRKSATPYKLSYRLMGYSIPVGQ